jgi:hypothetical protein
MGGDGNSKVELHSNLRSPEADPRESFEGRALLSVETLSCESPRYFDLLVADLSDVFLRIIARLCFGARVISR